MKKLLPLSLALLCLAVPATASGAGRLDPSFGAGGRAVWPTSLADTAYGVGTKAAESPDGRTFVLLGERRVLAFTASGQIDGGFGAGGSVEVFRPDELVHGPVSIAVDRQGRLLVAATVVPQEPPDPTPEGPPENVPEQDQAILLARYTPQGQPDPGFGAGGRLITRLGFPPPRVPESPFFGPGEPRRARVAAAGIAIDGAGRIVLSGTYLAAYDLCSGPAGYRPHRDAFLARLGEDGRPDPGFDRDGVAILREGPVGPPAVDESGGVLASVGTPLPCEISRRESAGYLFHLDAAGAPVASFGQGGWRPIPEDPYVKLLPDGRGGLLLMPDSASWRRTLILRRLGPDGTWDRSFGRRSVAEPFPAPKGTLTFTDAALGAGGHVYVTGIWRRKARGAVKGRFLLFRLDRSGILDRRYGVLRTGFGKGSKALSLFLLMAPEGRPLAVGPVASPLLPGGEGVALARYLPGR